MADPQGVQWSEHLQPQYLQDLGQRWNRGRALSRLPPASDWEWWGMFRPGQICQCGPPLWDLVVPGFPAGLAKTFYKLYWSSIPPSFPHSLTMLVQQCDLKFSRHLVHPKDIWSYLVLSKMFIRHVAHTKMSLILGSVHLAWTKYDRTRFQGPFCVDHMSYGYFG